MSLSAQMLAERRSERLGLVTVLTSARLPYEPGFIVAAVFRELQNHQVLEYLGEISR